MNFPSGSFGGLIITPPRYNIPSMAKNVETHLLFWKVPIFNNSNILILYEEIGIFDGLGTTSLKSESPAAIYLFKVNNENIRVMCEKWPKLTINAQKQCYCSGVFCQLWTYFTLSSNVSIFEKVIISQHFLFWAF